MKLTPVFTFWEPNDIFQHSRRLPGRRCQCMETLFSPSETLKILLDRKATLPDHSQILRTTFSVFFFFFFCFFFHILRWSLATQKVKTTLSLSLTDFGTVSQSSFTQMLWNLSEPILGNSRRFCYPGPLNPEFTLDCIKTSISSSSN